MNDTVNQPVQNPSHLTGINDSSSPVSEAVTGRTAISEVDRAVEGCSKKCTSSFDSHSIEQIDSASESDLKPTNDMLKVLSLSLSLCLSPLLRVLDTIFITRNRFDAKFL